MLPDIGLLQVDEAKARDYLLNTEHREGGAKALFFLKFGFTRRGWRKLVESLRLHGQTRPIVVEKESTHGRKYEVRCNLSTPDGRNPCIRSVWIKDGDKPPRLVTVLPRA